MKSSRAWMVVLLTVGASGCQQDSHPACSLSETWQAFAAFHQHCVDEANKTPPKPVEPPWTEQDDALPDTLEGQREEILRKLRERMGVSEEAITKLRDAFGTYRTGQGNPKVTKHPPVRFAVRKTWSRCSIHRNTRQKKMRPCASINSNSQTSLVSIR